MAAAISHEVESSVVAVQLTRQPASICALRARENIFAESAGRESHVGEVRAAARSDSVEQPTYARLAASLRHAASMHNPQFYEKQRIRASTWDIPRFLQFFDETIDGGLIVPRGMLTTVTELAAQAGSKLDLADERAAGTTQAFTCSAVLTGPQQAAVQVLTGHDLGCWSRHPEQAKP